MTPLQLEQVKNVIRETVNGKIDQLDNKIDEYIRVDNEWKAGVTPSIEIMKKMQGFASTGNYILKGIVLIGAVATTIWAFIKFIANK